MALVGPGQNAIIQEIAQKKLKRTPPPKPPDPHTNQNESENVNSFQSILRTTGKRGSLMRDSNFQNDSQVTSEQNELAAIFKRRRAVSEQEDDSEMDAKVQDDIPPWKKELMRRKKQKEKKEEPLNSEEKESESLNSNSAGNNHKEQVYPFKDGPPLQPLPSLLKAGKQPKKPPKSSVDVKALIIKYRNSIIVAPKNGLPVTEEDASKADKSEVVVNEEEETIEQEDYDDVTDVVAEVKKRLVEEPVKPQMGADFDQEDYDDVGVVKQVILEQETYDDVSAAGNANSESNVLPSGDGEEFGDDVYEPVKGVVSATDDTNKQEEEQDEYELLPGEMEQQQQPKPSNNSNINNNNHKKNTLPKVDQKKLKKEQEELKKKQREESKRLEKEKKKQEEEKKKREKVNADLKKKHKLKGDGTAVGNGLAKDNWKGSGKHDLSLQKNESVFIISYKDGCPSGKCLIRSEAGNLGYVPADMIQEYVEEDEYAEIDSKLINKVLANQNNLPPPSTLPPSLPVQQATPADQEQETYDDLKAGEDEELYEPI